MNTSFPYIIISIAVLAIIAILIFILSGKKVERKITPLAGVALAFILAGILFGEDKWVGYSLIGIGVVLAVADIIMKSRSR